MTTSLQKFADNFCALNKTNLHRLPELYASDISFTDPLHHISGIVALHAYFEQLYDNVSAIKFDIHAHDCVSDTEGYLRWTMHFSHPRLRGGQTISVKGCTHLKWRDKVYYHHDYFDAGAMLYENVPVLGSVIAWLKIRLAT